LEKCKKLAEKFNAIEEKYKNNNKNYKVSDQKTFFIIYIIENAEYDITNSIEKLEKCLKEYNKDEETSEARKLIQRGFKDFVVSSLKIN
jgi:thiol-disulfide isomerase/thioredoxin